MNAERQPTVLPVERNAGSGRQPAEIEAQRDALMDLRAAVLDVKTFANDVRVLARRAQNVAIRDDSFDGHGVGVELEARANRLLRQYTR